VRASATMGDLEKMESSIGISSLLQTPGLNQSMVERVQGADKNAGAHHITRRIVEVLRSVATSVAVMLP
jgi:hypothetical protein